MEKIELNREDLELIVKGACFLASAGGGTYTSGMNLVSNFGTPEYYPADTVEVKKVDEVDDLEYGVMVAYIGSPESMEQIYYPREIVHAVQQLQKRSDQKLSYIIPAEIGAISSIAACTTAARLGMAVIDGDGAGRAVPELSMTAFSLHQKNVNPVYLASEKENEYVCLSIAEGATETAASEVEAFVRPVLAVPSFGQKAGLAMWVLNGKEIKEVITSRNTLTGCVELGKCIREHNRDKLFRQVREMSYGNPRTVKGTATTIHTSVGGGFDTGMLTFTSEGSAEEDNITVLFQNESLIAWDARQTEPLTTAPNIISYLVEFPSETGEDDRYGRWVYSNGDLQGLDADKLREAEMEMVIIDATPDMYRLEDCLQNRCEAVRNRIGRMAKGAVHSDSSVPGDAMSSVLKSYREVLASLGYYGGIVRREKQ